MSGFGGGGSGGAAVPNATTGVAGKVQIATQAQTYARTPYAGSTGAPLVPSITNLLIGRQATQNAFFNVAADGAVAGLGLKSLDVQGNRAGSKASGNYSVAVGFNCGVGTAYGAAVGYSCIVSTSNSGAAIGRSCLTSGSMACSFGVKSRATALNAQSFGSYAFSQSASGVSFGIFVNQTGGTLNQTTGAFSGAPVSTANGINSAAFGVNVSASGLRSAVFGVNGVARIQDTTVIQGPIIAPKSNGIAQSLAFAQLSGVQVILYTTEIDFSAAGATYTITLPGGARFFIDEVGVILEELDGTLTSQPSYQFGITGTNQKYLNTKAAINLGTIWQRDKWTNLNAPDAAETSLTFTITVSGVKNTATVYKGKAYWKGHLIETEP